MRFALDFDYDDERGMFLPVSMNPIARAAPICWQDLEEPFQEPFASAFTSSYQFFYQHVVISRARLLVLSRKAHRRWWRVARIILIRYAWRWL